MHSSVCSAHRLEPQSPQTYKGNPPQSSPTSSPELRTRSTSQFMHHLTRVRNIIPLIIFMRQRFLASGKSPANTQRKCATRQLSSPSPPPASPVAAPASHPL